MHDPRREYLDAYVATGVAATALFPEEPVVFEPRDGYVYLEDARGPIPAFNGIALTEPDVPSREEILGVRAHLAAKDLPFGVHVVDGFTDASAVIDELELTEVEVGQVMRLDRDQLIEAETDAASVEACRDPADIAAMIEVLAEVFEMDPDFFSAVRRSLEPGIRETFAGVVARSEEREPVATAAAFVSGGRVMIMNVATREPWRRRGIGGAMTVAVVRAGFDLGARFAWLISSPDGVGPYRAVGFRETCTVRVFG